jgi:hypothetical protein
MFQLQLINENAIGLKAYSLEVLLERMKTWGYRGDEFKQIGRQ